MASLSELRKALEGSEPAGHVENHGSEKHRVAQMLAQAYQDETDGKLFALQKEIGVWRRRQGFETHWKNVPEKLMLTVTELSEAMEAFRHLKPEFLAYVAAQDDEAILEWEDPNQFLVLENFGEELADTLIRLFDLADAVGVDLQSKVFWKMAINEMRPYKHGKEC